MFVAGCWLCSLCVAVCGLSTVVFSCVVSVVCCRLLVLFVVVVGLCLLCVVRCILVGVA